MKVLFKAASLVFVSLMAMMILGGCASSGKLDSVQVVDYRLVEKGTSVGLVAPTNSPVLVAKVNIKLSELNDIPDFVSGIVGNVQPYIVIGAIKTRPSLTEIAITLASNKSILIDEFYVVGPGKSVGLKASANAPAVVIEVVVDLNKIEGIPIDIGGDLAKVNSHIIFGATK